MNDFDKYMNHIIDTEFYAQEREEFTKKKLLFLKRKLLNILEKNQTIGDKRKFKDTLRQLDKITDEEIDKLTKELEEERKQQIQKEDKYLRRLIGSALLASSFLSVYNADKILNAKFNSKDNFKSFKKNLKSNFKKSYTAPLNTENHFGGNTSHAENTVSRNIDRLINYAASDVHTMTTATQRDTYKAVIHNSGLKLQYVAILDSHLCPVCSSLHGQVFNEDEAPNVPLHERCRCVLVYVKGNGYQLRDFDEWLKRQPNEVQEKILGKTRYAMYKSGYISKVSQFTSKNRLMTLDELYSRRILVKNRKELVYVNPKLNTTVICEADRTEAEFSDNLKASKILANNGHNIIMKERDYVKKSYDITVDNIPFEIKTNYTPTKSAIDNAIRSAGTKEGQSSNIILRITSNISMLDVKSVIKRRFIRKNYFKKIILIDKNDEIYGYFDRSDVLKW